MSVPNQRFKPGMRLELVTPDGETFELHTPPTRFVTGLLGFGMTAPNYNTKRAPFQHGERLISTKLDSREVAMTLTYPGCSRSEFWSHRYSIVEILRENRSLLNNPDPSQLILYYTENGEYKERALDVSFKDGAVFAEPDTGAWQKYLIVEEISFTAFNPILYDPTELSTAYTSFSSSLILPFTFPFTLGTYYSTSAITYDGTWEEYPIIEIVGPAKNISIVNNTIDKRINFWGSVASDETVTIDLTPSKKTATNNFDDDLLYKLSGNISTFSLQPAPIVAGGSNSISIYSEIFNPDSTQITLLYHNRYRAI